MSDQAIIQLAREIGCEDALKWFPSQNSYYSAGRIYSLASPFDLLRLPMVPFIDRLRIGLVTLYLQQVSSRGDRWKHFEQVTAASWLRRWLGDRAFDRTLGAQLHAKFGPRAEQIAMVWFWNKIYLRTQSRPGLLGQERLGYFDGSFNVFTDALVQAARREGADLQTGVEIQAIVEDSATGGLRIDFSHRSEDVDAVVVTTPAPLLARMMPSLPESYRDKLTGTRYQGAACVLLRMNRKLTDTYWLNMADSSLPFTVIVEHTNFIEPEQYASNHYLYVNTYVEPDHRYLSMSEADLVDEYLSYLPRINPDFDRSWIVDTWVFRTPAAQPIIALHHRERMPDHRAPVKGVYLATMSQIYPEDRGTNYAVALGEEVSSLVDEDFGAANQVAFQTD